MDCSRVQVVPLSREGGEGGEGGVMTQPDDTTVGRYQC